ncbi:hypothetical protein JX265_001937 [Neoarthrinium moseri]|uniref:Uncharacterized protein n=1 Tax=Neoarthrinium moseri TaxID=1658444 RepID=A0A9P9WWJ0_9PEZI|nr:hypothetical protein JX266_006041 [Neoarthrinium moseri]KAI1880316.1 hypothetical protein JX265_001937 [Neoarthrinium moseri]
MRFFKAFTTALAVSIPVAAVAKPSAEASFDSLLTRDEFAQFAKLALAPRQDIPDLGDALKNLLDLLKELQSFLNPAFFGDVRTVVTGLADLLEAPFANTTRGIVFTAADALGKVDLVGLLDQISPLLDSLGKLDIGGLIDKLSPLLDSLGKIDIAGLVDAATGLLTPDNIKIIGNLLGGANSLLTKDFIDQTKQLIADAQPLVSAVSQFITALITALLGG